MKKNFSIFVEGDADRKFFEDYISFFSNETVEKNQIVVMNGWDGLFSEATLARLHNNMDNGVANLVILDADDDIEKRRSNIEKIKTVQSVDFELFLLPNNKDCGALEDMLENIINLDNKPVMECWDCYEQKLKTVRIPSKEPPTLTIPAKKTKIYAYLETLLGKSKSQKKLIKESKRDYCNVSHWDLNSEYLSDLRYFLSRYLELKHK